MLHHIPSPLRSTHLSVAVPCTLLLAVCGITHTASADDNQLQVQGGTLLHYEGRLAPEGTQDAGQAIEWYVLAVPPAADSASPSGWDWLWVLEEAGRGGWDWTRRLGIVSASRNDQASLQFEHDSGGYVVRLPDFWHDSAKWHAGSTWQSRPDKLQFEVAGAEEHRGYSCWKVVVRTPIGIKRTIWVERSSGLLVDLNERVFMGRGEKYSLHLALSGSTVIDDASVTQAWKAAHQLSQLRTRLGKRQDEGSVPWTAEQLKTLEAFSLPRDISWAPLKRLLQQVEFDRRQQASQSTSLASLQKRALGLNVRDLTFRNAKGEEVELSSLGKGVVVLHFWEYRDSPLRPPYGQVGFLDFVSRKQDRNKVQVVGVVVHQPTESPTTRQAIVRSARKLNQFMNLSYPLVYDDGSALRTIGDPRPLGVSLPLYVVVDAHGSITAVHAGLYATDPNVGLRELEQDIAKALGKGNTGGD